MAAVETNATTTTTKKPDPIVIPAGSRLAKYSFRHEKLKDEAGNVIGKGTKHPTVPVIVRMPSNEELISALASPDDTPEAKVRDMIVDSVWDSIYLAGKRQINDFFENNPDATFKPEMMDLAKLEIQYIANLPKGSRGAWAPSDEDINDFMELYTEVMRRISYPIEKVRVHCGHWKNGMTKVKANKPVVSKLQELLTVFAANCGEEEFGEVEPTYTWLDNRASKYLKAEVKDTVEAL